jgi:uncharacterized protein (TIGR02246 family)
MAKKRAPRRRPGRQTSGRARPAARARAARPAGRARGRGAPRPSPAAAIVALDQEFMSAVAGRDAGALVAAFYAPDAVLMPPGHPRVEGRDAIRVFLQGLMDAGLSSIKLTTSKVWSAGALAAGRGSYALAMTGKDGVATEDRGKYVVCYRRQPNGQWRAIADIFNSDGPAG